MNYSVMNAGNVLQVMTATVFPVPYNSTAKAEYIQFMLSGRTELVITSKIHVNSAIIRPLSLQLQAELDDDKIHIVLEHPCKFSLEINGSEDNNLTVFAEEYKYQDFRPCIERVITFAPGIHDIDILHIAQDDTLIYISQGAFLNGRIEIENCSRVKICGYGSICMERYTVDLRPRYSHCLNIQYCQDIEVQDIMLLDSNDWSLKVNGCDNVHINNVKVWGCRGNSDGFDICGSRNVLVENVFTRVWDDSLVVKALDTGNVQNIVFRHAVLWNDFSRPIEVGVELRADSVKNVVFEDIDILHSMKGYPVMGIHHGDRAEVSDIRFENIRIEEAPGAQLFDIRIIPSYWNRDTRIGRIYSIVIRDIYYIGRPGMSVLLSPSRIQGYSPESNISGVTIQNVNILGRTADRKDTLDLQCEEYTENINLVKSENAVLEIINSRIFMVHEFTGNNNGMYYGKVGIAFENFSRKEQTVKIYLQISPAYTGEYDRNIREITIAPDGKISLEYDVVLPPGKYVAAIQSYDPAVHYSWLFRNLPLMIKRKSGISCGEQQNALLNYSQIRMEEKNELEFVNYYRLKRGTVEIEIGKDCLILLSESLSDPKCSMKIYCCQPVERIPNEVVYSSEETDFGIAPAVIYGKHGLELAPELRCPLEITLVFKNEPKVKEIYTYTIVGGHGNRALIPFKLLGISELLDHFLLEIEKKEPEVSGYRCPYTLFHSVNPENDAHMFADVYVC